MDEPCTHAARRAVRELLLGVFTVRDGRIQAVREYMDTMYAQRMLFADRDAA